MTLYLMSTTVIPRGADGTWETQTLPPEFAAAIARAQPFVSAVGHDSSAETMTAALGVPVAANRIIVEPRPGDRFLCLRLLSRAPEGVVLDRAGLDAIGFEWMMMTYHGTLGAALDAAQAELKNEIAYLRQRVY